MVAAAERGWWAADPQISAENAHPETSASRTSTPACEIAGSYAADMLADSA
jgi:hypothetical protein